nr:MAG TPA: hypothetical protein [Caudoviricetes sp.]
MYFSIFFINTYVHFFLWGFFGLHGRHFTFQGQLMPFFTISIHYFWLYCIEKHSFDYQSSEFHTFFQANIRYFAPRICVFSDEICVSYDL